MDNWIALILGIVQGLTEFFPVSSSGHLLLLESLFDIKDNLFFNVICHVGTLASIVTVFYKDLLQLNRKMWLSIGLATLPLFPCVILIKQVRYLFTQPQWLPLFFGITALLLFLSERKKEAKPITLKTSLLVGLGQTIALFPGISRSGTTIACGRFVGWSKEESIRFSFIMAIPAILGALTLESYKTLQEGSPIQWTPALIGLTTSYLFGLFALKRMVLKGNFKYFAWYCVAISIVSYMVNPF